MPIDDELIEVNDDELFMGDQHLKIDNLNVTEKEKETIPKVEKEEEDTVDPDEIVEVDDSVFNISSDEEDDTIENNKEISDEDTDKDSDIDLEDNDSEELNEFSAWGKSLADKGFFPNIEEEELSQIKDEEGLSEVLNKQLVTTFRSWQDNYKKNLVNNLVKEGYVNQDSVKDKISQTVSEDQIRSDIDVAKSVIKKYYSRIGTPEKEIQRIIDTRDDLEESALELNKLNEELDLKEQNSLAETIKQQEESALRQREEFNETLKNNVFAYEEFIPGRKLQKRDKEDVFMNIEPTFTKIKSNLAKYAPLLSYLDKYGILEGKFDKLINEGASKQTTKFAEILKEKSRKSTGTTHRRKSEGLLDLDNSDVPTIYK